MPNSGDQKVGASRMSRLIPTISAYRMRVRMNAGRAHQPATTAERLARGAGPCRCGRLHFSGANRLRLHGGNGSRLKVASGKTARISSTPPMARMYFDRVLMWRSVRASSEAPPPCDMSRRSAISTCVRDRALRRAAYPIRSYSANASFFRAVRSSGVPGWSKSCQRFCGVWGVVQGAA